MGVLNVNVNGKTYELDDEMRIEELKEILGFPFDFIVFNSKGERIKGKFKGKVKDGETLFLIPKLLW